MLTPRGVAAAAGVAARGSTSPQAGRSRSARAGGPASVGPAQHVGEALGDLGVLAVLPQGHDHELPARLVLHAHVDEAGPLDVADVGSTPLPRLHAPRLDGPRDPRSDLQPRLERAAHALQVALDRVVGHRDEGHRSCSSPNTGDSGSSATRRIASRTPGMKLVRSVVTWRMVSVWATSPKITSWSATSPGRRTEWIGGSPSMSAAVRAAVPDGLSSLPAWWYSMISAEPMSFDASAAKRIINTAPMAKFAATKTLPGAPATAARRSSSDHPDVPMTTCTPAAAACCALATAWSGSVKSTSTSAASSTSATDVPSAGSA